MNIIYIKTRIIISLCIYIILLLGYILSAKFFIKLLPPVKAIDNKFAVSILSKPSILQEIPKTPPPPVKEQEIALPVSSKPPLPANTLDIKEEERKKANIEAKKKEEEKRAFEKKQKLLLQQQEEKRKLEEKKRLEEIMQREIDMQTIIAPASYEDDSLHNSAPKYPVLARKEEEEGEVILLVTVSSDGKALEIKILKSSGYPRLDNASIYSVSTWKFKPAKNKLGMPVESTVKIPFKFELKNSKPQY